MTRFWLAGILALGQLCFTVFPAGAGPGSPLSTLHREMVEEMAYIPAGIFPRGCNELGPDHGAPRQEVYLDAFFIDQYEVTNEKFEKVMPEHVARRSRFSYCDDCPVSKITWYDAMDYCYLIGKSLPSEAQWEKAAGAGNGCEFPWGPDFDPQNPRARGGLKLRDKASPVGTFSPNRYGVFDMAGNVWEWVSDWFRPYFHTRDILYNPRGPSRGIMKVRRGGSWSDSVKAMVAGYRDWSYPNSRSFNDIGFRCVVNLVERK